MKKIISLLLSFTTVFTLLFFASCEALYKNNEDGVGASNTSSPETSTHTSRNISETTEEDYFPSESETEYDDTDETYATNADGSVIYDPIEWGVDDSGALTLSGNGKLPEYQNAADAPWYQEAENIKSAVISGGVTKIGAKAFNGLSGLAEIKIPSSVKDIDVSAFTSCPNLQKISVDESNGKYSSDENGVLYNKNKSKILCIPASADISSYTIPDSVTKIGEQSFRGCTGLKEITIPDKVTEIGDYAFTGCSSLESVNISKRVTKIGSNAFSSCANIKNFTVDENNKNYSSDENGALLSKDGSLIIRFPSLSGNTDVTLSENVTQIGDFAFAYCEDLRKVTIPDGVKTISAHAFLGCNALSEISIPLSVNRIGAYAFDGCKNLKKIAVDQYNMTYASDNNGVLFDKGMTTLIRCPAGTDMTEYTLPESAKIISVSAFEGCASLKKINLPNGITRIDEGAFSYCASLETIILPASLEKISTNTFSACAALRSVTMHNGVTAICSHAFDSCSALEEITLPESLEKIEANAFAYCTSLRSITIPNSVNNLGENIFDGCASLVISCGKNSPAVKYAQFYKIKHKTV